MRSVLYLLLFGIIANVIEPISKCGILLQTIYIQVLQILELTLVQS